MLDTIPVANVGTYEKEFLAFIQTEYAEITKEIHEKRELSDAGNAKFKEAVARFLTTFKTKHKLA
jgi:F-type H+-transporting ATPase subunit alpha